MADTRTLKTYCIYDPEILEVVTYCRMRVQAEARLRMEHSCGNRHYVLVPMSGTYARRGNRARIAPAEGNSERDSR